VAGAADKAPTTLAGRVLVTMQLYFVVVFMCLYTGGVATFLMDDTLSSKVKRFGDFMDKKSLYYNPENTLCVSKTSKTVNDFLTTQLPMLKKNTDQTKWNVIVF